MTILPIPSILDEFSNVETIPASETNEVGYGFHQYDVMILDDVQDRLIQNVESELDSRQC